MNRIPQFPIAKTPPRKTYPSIARQSGSLSVLERSSLHPYAGRASFGEELSIDGLKGPRSIYKTTRFVLRQQSSASIRIPPPGTYPHTQSISLTMPYSDFTVATKQNDGVPANARGVRDREHHNA